MPKVTWSSKSIPSICIAVEGKRIQYTFEGVRGLALDCLSSGERNWIVRYTVRRGAERVERKVKLGQLAPEKLRRRRELSMPDVLTPTEARARAESVLSQVRDGRDPWLESQQQSNASTPQSAIDFDTAFRAFLTDPRKDRRRRTVDGYQSLYDLHLRQRIGSVALSELDAETIESAVLRIAEHTTNPARGHRGLQATKALGLIRAVLEFCVKKRQIPFNPARQIEDPAPKKNPAGKLHRPLTEEELRRTWLEAPKYLAPQQLRALQLVLLLGRRVSELTGARKSEVSLEKRRWIIAVREGNKSKYEALVPLPPLALKLLHEAMEASPRSEFVFSSSRSATGHMCRQAPSQGFKELRRAIGISDNVRFHDARGLMNDGMAQMRVPSEYRSHVFHHTGDIRKALVEDTYSTYEFETEQRQALELWESRLLDIVSGSEPRRLYWKNDWEPEMMP